MEMKNWSRAMLSMYRYFEPLTIALDKIVISKSSNTYYSRSSDIMLDFDDILELTERKILYINLKLLIDETLLSLDHKFSKILILKYFENYKTDSLCETLDCIPRTLFRQINVAIREFGKVFQKHLEKNPNITKQMTNDGWICSVYEYMSHKLNGRRICKDSLKNMKEYANKEIFSILNNVVMESNAI